MGHRDDIIYSTVHRNGSGQDAGRIDYGIYIVRLMKLSRAEILEMATVARQMADELEEIAGDE